MLDKGFVDTRDDFEIDFDDRFNSDESEDLTVGNDDGDMELSLDDEDYIGDRRIRSKSKISFITREEYNELTNALRRKKTELEEAVVKMNEKKEDGDLSENEAYHYWKDKVYSLNGDISKLENDIKTSKVTAVTGANKTIGKGSRVHVVIEDINGVIPAEDLTILIVSSGHSGISDDGIVKVPENSEVFKRMEGKTSGNFNLTGTDGNNYKYKFELVGGV